MKHIEFKNNPNVEGRQGHFLDITVNIDAVVKSWRKSVFSYEWLTPGGAIKTPEDLSPAEAEKRADVESQIKANEALAKPVLGIGTMDNIEIGSGRAELLTLAANGIKTIPVHIPKSNEKDFKAFRAEIPS